jgi:hypothetical protein
MNGLVAEKITLVADGPLEFRHTAYEYAANPHPWRAAEPGREPLHLMR